MPIKKEILYPIFLECCEFTNDIFWENVFEDLSYGKTPYGTYISKDSLCCNYKDKEFNYKIEKKDPKELYNDIYNLLSKKLGLLSQRDKLKKKIDFYNIEEEIKEGRKNWSSIRKKNIKDLCIEKYVIDMKNKYCLSTKQAKYLLSTIFIAMVFKVITSKDIHYENGKIQHIDGILLKKKQIILERDIYNSDNNYNNCIIIDSNLIFYNWDKYILSLKKMIISN
jgi:hypothetical protein